MFSWKLYHDEVLIEEYNDVNSTNDIFYVNEYLTYNNVDDILYRKNVEYEIEINFKDNNIKVKYVDNYEGVTSLIYSKVTKDNHNITIIYQIDENEPINKVIIARKD